MSISCKLRQHTTTTTPATAMVIDDACSMHAVGGTQLHHCWTMARGSMLMSMRLRLEGKRTSHVVFVSNTSVGNGGSLPTRMVHYVGVVLMY